jgi:transcriptional regulator with XRE-family HTH domain
MDCKAVGERIKARKQALKMTVEDLYRKSGVPEDTINNIIYGRTTDPRIESLAKIAQALDVSLDFIVFGKAQDPQPQKQEEPQKSQFDVDKYIQVMIDYHARDLENHCKVKDELIAELRQHNAFWRKLSTGLIGFLGVILVWLAVSKVIG